MGAWQLPSGTMGLQAVSHKSPIVCLLRDVSDTTYYGYTESTMRMCIGMEHCSLREQG